MRPWGCTPPRFHRSVFRCSASHPRAARHKPAPSETRATPSSASSATGPLALTAAGLTARTKLGQHLAVAQQDRVHAVRTGVQVRPCALDRRRQHRTRVRSAQEHVDAGVDHQVPPRGLAHRRQPCRLLLDRPHTAARVVGVLVVAADRAGGQQPLGELRSGQPVAALGVHRHRHRHRPRDACGGGEYLLGGRGLPARVAQRGGDDHRRRGHHREAGLLDQPRGVGVPRVRQEQRFPRDVQRPQRLGGHLGSAGSGLWLVTPSRLNALITVATHATATYWSSVNTLVACW